MVNLNSAEQLRQNTSRTYILSNNVIKIPDTSVDVTIICQELILKKILPLNDVTWCASLSGVKYNLRQMKWADQITWFCWYWIAYRICRFGRFAFSAANVQVLEWFFRRQRRSSCLHGATPTFLHSSGVRWLTHSDIDDNMRQTGTGPASGLPRLYCQFWNYHWRAVTRGSPGYSATGIVTRRRF